MRDVRTTRFDLKLNLTELFGPSEELPAARPNAAEGRLWVDEDLRLRKLEITEGSDGPDAGTHVIELYDFGVDVNIQTPPASETIDFRKGFGKLMGEVPDDLESFQPELAGTWHRAAGGRWRDVTWGVFTADARMAGEAGRCLTFELDPPPNDYPDPFGLLGEVAGPKHNGNLAACLPTTEESPLELLNEYLPLEPGRYFVLAGVAAHADAVIIGLRGGDKVTVDVDPASGVFAWFSPKFEEVVAVGLADGSITCEIDSQGFVEGCA